jgi:hypothetical protein
MMFDKPMSRFRRWLDVPARREAAKDQVIAVARVLADKITNFEEMGVTHRILVEALEHLDKINSEKN